MRARWHARLGLVFLVFTTAAGNAQEPAAGFGASARVRAPIAATNAEDATAAGSTIRARDRRRALEETSEAMVEVPGVRVTNSGGAGSFSGVALRGAQTAHTSILLGSIPLTTPDSGSFDLSVLPLSALDRIEIYRGGAPAWFSEGAIGGVVRFVPERGEQDLLQATLGAGSFGRRELRLTSEVSRTRGLSPAVFAHARLLHADNDYPYIDDGQTRFDPNHRTLHQQNADHLSGDGLLHAGLDGLGGRLHLLLAGHGRIQGVPGPLAAPTPDVRASLVRSLVGLSYDRDAFDPDGERAYRLQLVASGSHQRSTLTDLEGQLGRSREVDSDDVWQRAHLRAAGGLRVFSFLEASAVLGASADAYRPENNVAFGLPQRPSRRVTASATLEPRLYGRALGMRAELRPSLRLALSQSTIYADTGLDRIDYERQELTPTYRLAGVVEPTAGLSLAASLASGTRLPSMFELFGDRLYLEANPRLREERSLTADASVVLRGRAGELRGALEARGFALWVDDLITYERTSQYTLRPRNVASARVLGLELGFSGGFGRHISLSSSLTAMNSQNQFGLALPLRPPLQALVRPEILFYPDILDQLSLFAEAHHVSFFYLDGVQNAHWPSRTLLSLGASVTLFASHVTLEARVNDVLNVQPVDVLSRPLPGRELRVALTVRERGL